MSEVFGSVVYVWCLILNIRTRILETFVLKVVKVVIQIFRPNSSFTPVPTSNLTSYLTLMPLGIKRIAS